MTTKKKNHITPLRKDPMLTTKLKIKMMKKKLSRKISPLRIKKRTRILQMIKKLTTPLMSSKIKS
jgi:hypothetical protein